MAFICDPTTRAELNAAPNKLAWSAIINAALGNTRRIRCRRDPDAAAADPWLTGTEFRNVGSTGSLKLAAGKVIGLGRIKGGTVSLPADVSTGASVVRIEGNGRFIQGTLGPATAPAGTYDFQCSNYFTATNGLALKPDFAISGPMFLPSGTGPAAPDVDADMPTAFRLIDYTTPASPVIVGTAQINVRDLDMVMDHPQIASEMGDVRMTRCADGAGIVFGTGGDCFRFAATVLSMNKVCNQDDPNKPVHQVLINAAPHGRWPSYPFRKDFDIAVDTLMPKPFKIELLRANGTVLHVFEMYSTQVNGVAGTGLAINDPAQFTNNGAAPVRPWWTCQMMLKWQSHKIKRNTKAQHYLPGVEADALATSNVSAFDSGPQCWPLITGRYLVNGLGAWRMYPKWSRGGGTGSLGFDTSIIDTGFLQPARDNYVTQVIGWGYEPGSTGGHTWFMSPGGSRHDRACWPHVMVAWASNPTGNRPHGNVPMEELKDAWLDNYFNEGCHYHPSATLERGISVPKDKVLNGLVAYNDTYYNGGNESFVPDPPNNCIRLLSAGNASDGGYLDKYGRNFVNEYQRDNQHSYSNGALGVYINNSPAHVISARHTFNSHVLCAWGMTSGLFNSYEWLTRQHAWHEWQFTNMWIATTSDARSISRTELEAMWEKHLHAMHDSVMPRFLNGTDVASQALRNIGINVDFQSDATSKGYVIPTGGADSKLGYMGQVLLLMKQSGAWDAMRARSVKCREILDLLVTCLAKATADCFLDGDGRIDRMWFDGNRTPLASPLGEPTWANFPPKNGNEDWIHGADGSLPDATTSYIEPWFNTQHFRAQCVWIIRDYFPEINYPRIDAAAAKVDGYYATIESRRLAGTGQNWHWRFAMMGKFKKAATIGAPA
jgi:hypothetical protein